jgi:radical SAM superfamily enzyme YgiQ (UPF0313 family)
MHAKSGPTILIVYPSSFHYPNWLERTEVKTSQLLLASYLSKDFPVIYGDFETSIGRPDSSIQIRRYERRVRDYFEKYDFDVLAISCWTSLSYKATMTAARIAREVRPNLLIVVGGYHAMARPDDFRTDDNIIDYVIQGEGEQALAEIVKGFPQAGRPPRTVVLEGQPLYPENFVGMDWDLVDDIIAREYPAGIKTLVIYLARGCPFECTFCMESLKERRWRPCPPSKGIEQIREAAGRYRIEAIGIGDACFGVRSEWRKEFLQRLSDLNPSYWVVFETRPEYLDEEDIKMMAQLKVQVQFGLESCSPKMLQIMNKTREPEKFLARFRETSHLLSQYNILHGANLIFNHPGETEETLEETFAWMDSELEMSQSSLIWACSGYMHFPGNRIDQNQSFYEQQYGTRFLCPQWWLVDEDQFLNSGRVVPSRDLDGERLGLWKRMLRERDEKLRNCLTTAAFRQAADTYFPRWRSDPRYVPADSEQA